MTSNMIMEQCLPEYDNTEIESFLLMKSSIKLYPKKFVELLNCATA